MTGLKQLGALRFADELAARAIPFWARYVLIPGHTDGARDIAMLTGALRAEGGGEAGATRGRGGRERRSRGRRAWTSSARAPRAHHAPPLLPPTEWASRQPSLQGVELLPYHTYGRNKWEALGLPYPLEGVETPEPAAVRAVVAALEGAGLPVLCDAKVACPLSNAHTGAHS